MITANKTHEQDLEEFIEELANGLHPEGIRFRSGKNYIYHTRKLLRFLLCRDPRCSRN